MMALEDLEHPMKRLTEVERARQRLADVEERGEPADLTGGAARIKGYQLSSQRAQRNMGNRIK